MGGDKGISKKAAVLACALVLALAACAFLLLRGQAEEVERPSFEQSQAEYVEPETPVDRSRSISLPGWSSFTIPANTTTITQGFEFHNPAENIWYEDLLSVGSAQPEVLVVDSGESVELNHYLALAGKGGAVSSVLNYDAGYFEISQDEEGSYAVRATAGFEGQKAIEVETDSGARETITATCVPECYYMTFGLYLAEGDELLYQSGLVAPGKYLQQMELSRPLESGTYDAYVVCQPYQSDQTTKTNQGIVRITLNVQ